MEDDVGIVRGLADRLGADAGDGEPAGALGADRCAETLQRRAEPLRVRGGDLDPSVTGE